MWLQWVCSHFLISPQIIPAAEVTQPGERKRLVASYCNIWLTEYESSRGQLTHPALYFRARKAQREGLVSGPPSSYVTGPEGHPMQCWVQKRDFPSSTTIILFISNFWWSIYWVMSLRMNLEFIDIVHTQNIHVKTRKCVYIYPDCQQTLSILSPKNVFWIHFHLSGSDLSPLFWIFVHAWLLFLSLVTASLLRLFFSTLPSDHFSRKSFHGFTAY